MIKHLNSPSVSRQIRRVARATNKVDEPEPCPKHPRYEGKGKPKNGCRDCWRIYLHNT